MNEFAAFILTHGRPNKVYTFDALQRYGYTGKIIIVIDDEDKTREEYKKNFDHVEVFSKEEIAKTFDSCDNFSDKRTIIYARNACFEIAKKLGYKTFIQLDDDYRYFQYRFDHTLRYGPNKVTNLDKVFKGLVKVLEKTNITTICLSQGGDFMGGSESTLANKIKFKRKAMNSFVCSLEKPFSFIGRINEDVNTYVSLGSKGNIFLTTNQISLEQNQTQSNAGGMTEVYINNGTYVKSFYSVIINPSCVKITRMGRTHRRLHHKIKWKNAVPMILREEIKKL